MRIRIAVVAMAIAALIALALATRVAAQTADTRMQIQSNPFPVADVDGQICKFGLIVMLGAVTR